MSSTERESTGTGLPWHIVEGAIKSEIEWLRQVIAQHTTEKVPGCEEDGNLTALQILLGHESLDTTTRYVHASDRYAEETHHKYHPLAKSD